VKPFKLFLRFFKNGFPRKGLRRKEALGHIAHLENAFSHLLGMIGTNMDLGQVLWEITRECLHCVGAPRIALFFMEPAPAVLDGQLKFVYSFDHESEQAYQREEEEIVEKSFEQDKPFLLEIEDLRAIFPGRNPDWELISAMTFPVLVRGKAVGILSAVSFNGNHGFDEESFQLFSGFAKLTSIAVEMADLLRGMHREALWRKDLEEYLDRVLIRLQGSKPHTGEKRSTGKIYAGANGPLKKG
jgi:GAF domain-containing protein